MWSEAFIEMLLHTRVPAHPCYDAHICHCQDAAFQTGIHQFAWVAGDGDCAFRAIVVAILEQAFSGNMLMLKPLMSKITLGYTFMPLSYHIPEVELGHNTLQVRL